MANTREIIRAFHTEVSGKRREFQYDFRSLKGTALEDDDIVLLCDGLKNISAQRSLNINLSNNQFGSVGVQAIINWIRSGFVSPQVNLRMKGIDILENEARDLRQAVRDKSQDRDISLHFDPPCPRN